MTKPIITSKELIAILLGEKFRTLSEIHEQACILHPNLHVTKAKVKAVLDTLKTSSNAKLIVAGIKRPYRYRLVSVSDDFLLWSERIHNPKPAPKKPAKKPLTAHKTAKPLDLMARAYLKFDQIIRELRRVKSDFRLAGIQPVSYTTHFNHYYGGASDENSRNAPLN